MSVHRIFLVFFSVSLLSACSLFSSSETTTSTIDQSTVTTVSGASFSIQILKNWQTFSSRDLPIPQNGTIAGAYTSPDISKSIVPNLLILQDSLDTIITSAKYSDINRLQAGRKYLEYTDLGEEEITFPDTDVASVAIFEARYNETAPMALFLQVAKVC